MKPLCEQDHYETLEISPGASAEDVERAYRMACSTYSEDSLAGYSVFEDGDAEVLRERIEIAYRTLSDPELRCAYDAELARRNEAPAPDAAPSESERADPALAAAPPVESVETLDLEDLDDEGASEFDGARLRRARLRNGVELEEIAGVTKVNPTYLRFLEEERFDELPAAVYVRGFVMGYASCVGLEPAVVARSYMQRYEAVRDGPKRRRFSRH